MFKECFVKSLYVCSIIVSNKIPGILLTEKNKILGILLLHSFLFINLFVLPF